MLLYAFVILFNFSIFLNVNCNKVRKEADRVGSWRLGWILFTDKLKQVRTLRVLKA